MNPNDSLDSSIEAEDKMGKRYNHEDVKTFLASSTIKDYFRCAHKISHCQRLLSYFHETLSSLVGSVFDLKQILDCYILAIMMMTYEKEKYLFAVDRFMLLNDVSNLECSLELDQIEFIANGLYERFVQGECGKPLENVLNMQRAIPQLVLSSGHGNAVALALLLTILGRYTKVKAKLQITGNARKAFEMAQMVDWQKLIDSDQYEDMFMLMHTFGLLISMRNVRNEFVDDDLGKEMQKYFLNVRNGMVKKSDIQTAYVMMVERYIAFCVVRVAAKNP